MSAVTAIPTYGLVNKANNCLPLKNTLYFGIEYDLGKLVTMVHHRYLAGRQ